MSKQTQLEILRWLGRHRFVAIRPCSRKDNLYGGWACLSECNTHEKAMQDVAERAPTDGRVFEKVGRGKWREVRAHPAPKPTTEQANQLNRKVLGDFFAGL